MEKNDVQLYNFTTLDASYNRTGRGRRSGLHVSGLVKAVLEAKGKKLEAPSNWQDNVAMQTGFLWENALEWAFKEYMGKERKVKKQLAVELDGVHGTPDGLDGNVLEEYKVTWKSLKKWNEDPEENFDYWFMQVKAYLHMLGLNTVRFFVFFVNGDYKWDKGVGPRIVRTAEFTFTDAELEDNWTMLMAHRPKAKEEE